MKIPSLILIAALLSASGAAFAANSDGCTGRRCGSFAPLPPAPPAPPAPPSMPAPPAPPAPPAMIDAPAAAHALCSGKAPGTAVSYKTKNESMTGTCERDNRGMYFDIDSYHGTK